MAHRSQINSAPFNVGWFNQLWLYAYEVVWIPGLGANGSIREVKISKTITAAVVAPIRLVPVFPFVVLDDPRMDLPAPTYWKLWKGAPGNAQFEFNYPFPPVPPVRLPPPRGFIPPLAPPAPWAPAPPPANGQFVVYSVENPVEQKAWTGDHLGGTWPPLPQAHTVWGPNRKKEHSRVYAYCTKERGGYRYTYTLRSDSGEVNQAIIFLQPEVNITSLRISHKAWSTFRVGVDKPKDIKRADGKPTKEQNGILFFGSFDNRIGPKDEAVSVSFFSKSSPGYISVLANNFSAVVVGPVVTKSQRRRPRSK